ncbi:MAG: hypothetical protein QM750_14845 [Rubrivivax sp.]
MQLLDGRAEHLLLDVRQDDARTFAGQRLRRRQPDAAGAAGDHGHLAPEVFHRAALLGIPAANRSPRARTLGIGCDRAIV